jgi:hypothetical protein
MTILAGLMRLGGAATSAQEANGSEAVGMALARPRVAKPASEAVRRMERLERLVEVQAWDDAADLADELLTGGANGWVAVEDEKHVGVREAVNRRLAKSPADGLSAYRQRVDPVAEAWLREGKSSRDEPMLRKVVDEAFCSSAGDDALWALGEIHLERRQFLAARTAWQRVRKETAPGGLLSYPDSEIDLAEVRARLALVSIREGDIDRAQREVDQIARLHSDAAGRLAGCEGNYAALLADEIQKARQRAPLGIAKPPERFLIDAVFEQMWTVATSPEPGTDVDGRPVNGFPVVVADRVLFQEAAGVHALSLANGVDERAKDSLLFESARGVSSPIAWALAAEQGRVFAVVPSVTSGGNREAQSRLIGLDVVRDGALIFQQTPSSDAAIFLAPAVVRDDREIMGEQYKK